MHNKASEEKQNLVKRRGLMYVLSSPSGAGKTTIARALVKQNECLHVSISATTRPRRAGEVHGQDYYFVSQDEFKALIDNKELLEYAQVFGNYYGTPLAPVQEALDNGQDVIFDIDWQGAQQLAEIARDDLVTVFVLPPSATELERRLRARARDTEDDIVHRMSLAANEITHYSEYDYVIVNYDLSDAIAKAQSILESERHRRQRQVGLADFVRMLKGGLV
jgi:guanylate kinase